MIQGAQLTHENMTAGVASVHSFLPPSYAISPLDTMVSAHSLSTAYGRTIAYGAVYEGTSFATLHSSVIYGTSASFPALFPLYLAYILTESTKLDTADAISGLKYPIPTPTLLFIKPGHLAAISTDVNNHASKSWLLYPFAWRHKMAGIREGFVTKESLWDRLLFDSARAKALGPTAATLRGVVVSGGVSMSTSRKFH